jgi:hypothetical protein
MLDFRFLYEHLDSDPELFLSKMDFMFIFKEIVAYSLLSLRFGFLTLLFFGNKFGVQYN